METHTIVNRRDRAGEDSGDRNVGTAAKTVPVKT